MNTYTLLLDSWFFKFALLAALLGSRYVLSRRGKSERKGTLREYLDSAIVTLLVVFFLVQPFIAQAYWIPTGSMENTLPPNDRILTSKLVYRWGAPRHGDVVVFQAPPAALRYTRQPEGTVFVKRCIGLPGDVVEIKNRVLWINDQKVAEPYTRWSDGNEKLEGRFSYDMKIVGGAVYSRNYYLEGVPGPWVSDGLVAAEADQSEISDAPAGKVPADKFLMLGDHRNASADGHLWGFVDRPEILGKAFAVFWPPTHWGLVDKKSRGGRDWSPALFGAAILPTLCFLGVGTGVGGTRLYKSRRRTKF